MDEPLRKPEPASLPDVPSGDYIYARDVNFDIDAQLMAIRGLLHRNCKEDQKIKNEIEQIEEHAHQLKGIHAEWAIDDWVDRIHHSAYQDAAHSMSALGMLAPLIETIFHQCFRGIGKRFYPPNYLSNEHERWKATHAIQWDCHMFVSGNRVEKNIVLGILQLADAVRLTSRLPSDLKTTLSALFSFRNKMFHNGFEWPVAVRESFAKQPSSGSCNKMGESLMTWRPRSITHLLWGGMNHRRNWRPGCLNQDGQSGTQPEASVEEAFIFDPTTPTGPIPSDSWSWSHANGQIILCPGCRTWKMSMKRPFVLQLTGYRLRRSCRPSVILRRRCFE